MNSVCLVGNLTRDPEYGHTNGDTAYCRFTVACQRPYKDASGQYPADFISCIAWRGTADFVNRYFIKGNKIGLRGSIQTRTYDAQDGSKRYVTEVLVENVEFVAARQDSRPAGSSVPPPPPPPEQRNEQQRMDYNDFQEVDDDELPF